MMKKVLLLTTVMVMMLAVAASAAPYLINFQAKEAVTGSYGSTQGMVTTQSVLWSGVDSPVGQQATLGVFSANNPQSTTMGVRLGIKDDTINTWYFKVWGRNQFAGTHDVRFWTTAGFIPAGNWSLFEGVGTSGAKVWSGNITATSFATAQSILITTGGVEKTYTLASVPEPGSIVAMLSGLVGLVGFGIRRRK